ncbi:MAG: hypothetical protein ABSD63_08545 [Candidatus Korobacteraceae bacterium]
MRKAAIFAFFVLLAASVLAQTAPAPAPPALTPTIPAAWPTAHFASTKDPSVQKAFQILNDMIKALGGDSYLNVRDIKTEGRGYAFYHGQPNGQGNLFWRFWEWPDKERVEFTKQRDIIELFVGDKGYEITYKGTAAQDPKEMQDYLRRRDHSLEWVVRKWLAASDTMILYDGTAMVEQKLTDQVTILNSTNDSVTLSIDPRSHLPVRKTYSYRDPLDRQLDDEAEVFSNYRLVQGIQTPMSVVRHRNGEMTSQRFITSVTYNNGFPPTMFETKGLTYNQPKSGERK